MTDVEKADAKYDHRMSAATCSDTAVELKSDAPSVKSTAPTGPDGGPRGWLTVFGAFLALFCTFGQLNSFGTFQTWYAEHQLHHLAPSTISWIGSLQLWVFFFAVRGARASSADPHSSCYTGMARRPDI